LSNGLVMFKPRGWWRARLREQAMPVAAPRAAARTFGRLVGDEKIERARSRACPRSATRACKSAKADLQPGRVCHVPEQGWSQCLVFADVTSGVSARDCPGGPPLALLWPIRLYL
jgi:hypothetical protein